MKLTTSWGLAGREAPSEDALRQLTGKTVPLKMEGVTIGTAEVVEVHQVGDRLEFTIEVEGTLGALIDPTISKRSFSIR